MSKPKTANIAIRYIKAVNGGKGWGLVEPHLGQVFALLDINFLQSTHFFNSSIFLF